MWSVPRQTAGATYTLKADCSTHVSGQTDSVLFPPLGASVQSSSPQGSVSSSHGTAVSISPKCIGRNRGRRYCSASQNKLASSIQGNLSFHSLKYKQSPEKVWADRMQAQAVASGTVVTRLHIGASLLGRCIGVCPYPGAQAQALETLLQQQNPANWEAGLAKHKQISIAQQVQQLARTHCPDLQQHLPQLQQITAFEVLPEAKMQHEAVLADIKACMLNRMADQAAAVQLHAQREAELVSAAENTATAVAAASAVAAEEGEFTEPKAKQVHADYAEILAQAATASALAEALTACGVEENILPGSASAAGKVAEDIAGIQAAGHTSVSTRDATTEDSQPEAAAAAMSSAETALTAGDIQGSADIADMSLPDSSSADALEILESEELVDLHHADGSLSDGSVDLLTEAQSRREEEAGNASEQLQPLTQAVVQTVMRLLQECSNSAYGRQAEHAMIQELESKPQQAQHAQHGNSTWHKMGAPDHQELGVYSGISFELGCQVDRALYDPQSGKAIPVELKNRVNRFPARLQEHEHVQVQTQLQLCNAPMGVLVERLWLPDGSSQDQRHEIVRDDRQWHNDIMPALHKFMAVVAKLATEQNELDMYLSKRVMNQHHSYLQHLLRQQG